MSKRLTDCDLIAIEREYCRRSLANFAKRAWRELEPSSDLKWGWALDSICDHLEAVTRGDIRRLLMNVPPGSMKSLLTGVIWPAWEWGAMDMQGLRYIGTAHKQDLAVRDSTKCRRLIQSEWYQRLWDVQLRSDQNAKTKFENARYGFREAMAFSSMTGARGDRVILDDPHSVDDANSRAKMEADITTFREALPSRVNNERSAIIIIMQRLSVGDVSDVALELGYQHLQLPMEYEAGRSMHVVGKPDPRTQEGELMFPERFDATAVAELKASLGAYATAGQLQQRPAPRGGGIIKGEWFRSYSVLPKLTARKIFADTAMKTAEHNDYSVFECWGQGADGNAYLLDIARGKWAAPELRRTALSFWAKHASQEAYPQAEYGALRAMVVEDKASGTGLIQDLKAGVNGMRVPVVGIERTKDKLTRVMDVLPYIESGQVYVPISAPWVSDFIGECESFTATDTHPYDDQIDPMCDAINDFLTGRRFNGFSAQFTIPQRR